MESVTEPRFLTLFCCQGLNWLEVEVVVQMQEIKIFTMDEKHEHVKPLSTNLETNFQPIHFSELEEFSTSKCFQ